MVSKAMPGLANSLLSSFPHLKLVDILDIVLVSILIYQFLMAVRGRRAAHILAGIGILICIYTAVSALGLELIRTSLEILAPYAPFALVVLFQSEIRRLLARIGGRRWLSLGGRLEKREFFAEIMMAFNQMSATKTGALVIIERDIGLRSFVESGVLMESFLSRDLLLTIFHHGSALHDGAVIVQGDRIAAAACFLPLTVRTVARNLGTRHRAALGITEETDCISLVVSEETGSISVAAFGEIEMDVTAERLEQLVTEHLFRRGRGAKLRGLSVAEEERLDRRAAHDARAD